MAVLSEGPRRALVFIGFMGAGKSTAANEVANALGVKALDSDRILEARLGHPIAEEFRTRGECAFRELEEQQVLELLADAGPGTVIALGGGSVLSARVQDALRAHCTVLLDIDANTAWERVGEHPERRPLAGEREGFLALHEQRRGIYEQLADAYLPTPARGMAARASSALSALTRAPAGSKLVWACSRSGDYPVLIGSGLLGGEVPPASIWPLDRDSSRAFCVSDELVAPIHGARIGDVHTSIEIPAGESQKTLASAERVWSGLLAGGMTRADHVVALGGGVVGDLAGFCAATYQRGVPVVQVPTTLVAQVDSAYGGKTGVDLPQAKNYVGAYHQPAGVIVDPDMLSTLPGRELSAGWVEVLKTALIAGGELWERVSAGEPVDERMILSCVRTKIAVVAGDERDNDGRQVLNLGHTVGHAIEAASGYERYRHGEAVGLGLLAALRLSVQDELRDQVRELLVANGLPVQLSGASVEDVLEAVARDKKRVGADVPFVLVRAPGETIIGASVEPKNLRRAVAELT